MKRLARAALWATVATGALLIVSFVPNLLGLDYVSYSPVMALLLLFLVCLSALFLLNAILAKGRLVRRITCGLLGLGGLVAFVYGAWVYSLVGNIIYTDARIELSPSGTNRLLLTKEGSFEASYWAYPMLNAFFYRTQDGVFIANYDWDGEIPQVEWISDTQARVWLSDGENSESVGDTEEIVVRFD